MLTNPWSQECDKFSQVSLFTMKKKNTFDKAQKYCWEETGVCMCYWCVCVCVWLKEQEWQQDVVIAYRSWENS